MNYFVSSGFREHEGGVNTNHRPVAGGLRWWAPEAGAGVGGGSSGCRRHTPYPASPRHTWLM